jgi:uncharacterized tellurite resistance protein B-like protein
MFETLFSRKLNPEQDEISARQAMAALMVRIAKSDDDYAVAECERIDAVLSVLYSLSASEASVPYEERFDVVRALWQVVLADGERDHEEDALMRLLASLLGVNDRDSAIARQRA